MYELSLRDMLYNRFHVSGTERLGVYSRGGEVYEVRPHDDDSEVRLMSKEGGITRSLLSAKRSPLGTLAHSSRSLATARALSFAGFLSFTALSGSSSPPGTRRQMQMIMMMRRS